MHLAVALHAVVVNALEALQQEGTVEVRLHSSGGEVHIEVADNGPGIAPEVRRHLFDPFFSARQAGRGLGLGLAKAWRIVTAHGGRIETASPAAPDHTSHGARGHPGALARIILPCAP